ncbi:hypothetical protein HPB47_001171 [Ixodes persulcatus]|uniref:Uncharacterized protein n=1 Tax=Ixodes persulcatus TaxID=34615 RepID=A0AC60PPX1_IXOPE|nr:hypothetical protein HPB47_001171 [Ixodes persulcatus]
MAYSAAELALALFLSVLVVNLEATVVLFGLTLLSLSFCGCVGALRENTCLLLTYSYFITALLLLNLALGVLVFFLPTQLKRMLRSTAHAQPGRPLPGQRGPTEAHRQRADFAGVANSRWRDENGRTFSQHEFPTFDHASAFSRASRVHAQPKYDERHELEAGHSTQRPCRSYPVELQCCGISQKDFRDWNDNMYFNCSRSNPSSERCSVPYSCCKKNSSEQSYDYSLRVLGARFTSSPPVHEQVVSLYCGQGVLNQTDYDAWFKIYTGNCVDAGHRFVRENVTLITGLCLVFVILLAFVQMVTQALVDEIIIIRRIYDRFYDRVFELRAADVTD